jgi:hypothetical protein
MNTRSGLTLIELIVSTAILIGIMLFIGGYFINVLNFQNYLSPAFEVQQELQATLSDMSVNIRTMNYSSLGAYPISAVSTSSLTFFVDSNGDGKYEQVRYFMSTSTMRKGVITPTGNPLTYNPANEVIVDVIHNVVTTSSIFSYYDSSYTGTEAAMTYPLDISRIKVIGVMLAAKQSKQQTPIYTNMKVTPRNIEITF